MLSHVVSRLVLMVLLFSPLLAEARSEPQMIQPTQIAKQALKNVHINAATATQLEAMAGMSAAKAKAIVAYRGKNGVFKSFEELKKVKGFKRMSADKLTAITAQMSLS